jgi:hypothetical protein
LTAIDLDDTRENPVECSRLPSFTMIDNESDVRSPERCSIKKMCDFFSAGYRSERIFNEDLKIAVMLR